MKTLPQDSPFWGKLRKSPDGVIESYHPLVDHCVDVACCAEVLLKETLLGRRLAALAGVVQLDDVTIARLCVIVGLHDIGKYNNGFQAKDGRGGQTRGHVTEGLYLLDQLCEGRGGFHETVAEALRLDLLSGWGEATLSLLTASVCHHGRLLRPPGAVSSDLRESFTSTDGGPSPIDGVGALMDAMLDAFPQATQPGPDLPDTSWFHHAFVGLVILSDWLGSDTSFFPHAMEGDAPRIARSRASASDAVRRIGISGSPGRVLLDGEAPAPEVVTGFRELRPMQALVHQLRCSTKASVTLLESDTGSGKTEAALMRFFTLYAAGEVEGLFFAVPTRSASHQLYRRVLAVMERVFGSHQDSPPVVLAVPGYLEVDGVVGSSVPSLPGFDVLWPDGDRSAHRKWAAENPKRFLSGAVVIGTVDQALLGGLNASHSHLRGCSLLKSLLVVDEVHASDTYMSEVLRELVHRQVKAGGHAMIMSATYGSEAKARLIKSSHMTFKVATAHPYPTVELHEGGVMVSSDTVKTPEREVHFDPRVLSVAEVIKVAKQAAEAGARVIILRNTVRDALETQRELEREVDERHLFVCGGVPTVHHGRYAPKDRILLDAAVESCFSRRTGVIVVSTQTLEQSLDIDADLLITDLCPADVLLQRVGRLHRHGWRNRPPGFETARCVVLMPVPGQLLEISRRTNQRGPHGFGVVYEDLATLELTAQFIQAHPVVSIPRDARLMVESAVHSESRALLVRSCPGWRDHVMGQGNRVRLSRIQAQESIISWADGIEKYQKDVGANARTRLSQDDRRTVSLNPPIPSPFDGSSIRRIVLPSWVKLSEDVLEARTSLGDQADTYVLNVDGVDWTYSRHGLEQSIG